MTFWCLFQKKRREFIAVFYLLFKKRLCEYVCVYVENSVNKLWIICLFFAMFFWFSAISARISAVFFSMSRISSSHCKTMASCCRFNWWRCSMGETKDVGSMSQSSISCSVRVILVSPSLFVNGNTLADGCGTGRCNHSSSLVFALERLSLTGVANVSSHFDTSIIGRDSSIIGRDDIFTL